MKIPIKFSSHAREKIQIRSVKISDVYETITTPDELYVDVEHGTLLLSKRSTVTPLLLLTKWRTIQLKL